ncbi:uncharacterized protein LOC128323195, partial [Hemicordylus capensis]|uniref:uncharacterized protein LOC128323195 n=1 Tax=Hemicordylus capensis TaxID=884348 RepID=UPI0023020F1A
VESAEKRKRIVESLKTPAADMASALRDSWPDATVKGYLKILEDKHDKLLRKRVFQMRTEQFIRGVIYDELVVTNLHLREQQKCPLSFPDLLRMVKDEDNKNGRKKDVQSSNGQCSHDWSCFYKQVSRKPTSQTSERNASPNEEDASGFGILQRSSAKKSSKSTIFQMKPTSFFSAKEKTPKMYLFSQTFNGRFFNVMCFYL